MTDEPAEPIDSGLRAQQEVIALRAQLDDLRAELEETNHGVIALYAELDAQAIGLRHAIELKSSFLSYISHEFRTPIGTIISISRILLDRLDGPLTEEQERQVLFIQQTSMEFGGMVDDLLDLAKVEAGQVDISPAWFELVDLFSTLRGMFKPVLVNPDLQLIFEEPLDTPKLYSDNLKLAQILRNFISNALKFTIKGEIRVSVNLSSDTHITFSVSDTGIGIAPEFHALIFQDFIQVDSPIQKRLRGTGLGLSVSKHLAELLGGAVGLRSEPQKGSVFFVTIPLSLKSVNLPSKGICNERR